MTINRAFIKSKLKAMGKNMKWLSKETGISYVHLSNIINSKANTTTDNLEKIRTALGTGMKDLIEN